jgi:hypothetical protein
MKQFEVELKRQSYMVFDIEADNEDLAIELAYKELDIPANEMQYWDLSYVDEK